MVSLVLPNLDEWVARLEELESMARELEAVRPDDPRIAEIRNHISEALKVLRDPVTP